MVITICFEGIRLNESEWIFQPDRDADKAGAPSVGCREPIEVADRVMWLQRQQPTSRRPPRRTVSSVPLVTGPHPP